MSDARSRPRALPDRDTLARQAVAADPVKSVWVSANAGSGKTYVLATRVIRLLLAGTDPSRILCLTYTKTAAAEMKDRVFRRLGEWVSMPEAQLRKTLEELENRTPDSDRIAFARNLFARALETPGGLKIQTIHAFCDALLHRFPLEANVPGHFEQPDTEMVDALLGQARAEMLAHIDGDTGGDLAAAFRTVIELSGESGLDGLLDEAIQSRSKLTALLREIGPAETRREHYLDAFGFNDDDTAERIIAGALSSLTACRPVVRQVLEASAGVSAKTGRNFAEGFLAALDAVETDPPGAYAQCLALFFTAAGKQRATGTLFNDKAVLTVPDFELAYESALETAGRARDRIALLSQIDNTLAALAVVDRLLEGYERLKRARGYLDFDDLIERTATLLLRPDVGAWVRYKLDQGIDHVLVDEAQDTSPVQWAVIRSLTDEFFDGQAARDVRRTLFAVGDEKQSIYSFQGADPASFGEAGEAVYRKARHVFGPEGFENMPLQTSFRSTQDVLTAVDTVFEHETNRAGVSRDERPTRHVSLRTDQPGRVEIWPMERASDDDEPTDWTAPVDAPPLPSVVVAGRVAATIADWLASGERLEGTGEKISAGDILVLVRSRDAFVGTLSRALKNHGVPVAGADRLRMTDHIAVLDLLALAKFVLQPADDLSLAAVLRSPLFDLDEETLFAVAYDRGREPLFVALRRKAEGSSRLRAVCAVLDAWRERGRTLPVYEFYASILAGENGREKLTGRLGPETPDMLDEFMRFALAQERAGLPSLQNFVSVLETASPEIKREMDPAQAQVRIMTVHGAKGLEAPVVFLVDRGAPPHSAGNESRFLEAKANEGKEIILWNCSGGPKSDVTEAARAEVARKAGEEYRRLLYVGMTRAADRLIMAGYAGKRGGKGDTWHGVVERALAPFSRTVAYSDFEALRFQVTKAPAVMSEASEKAGTSQTVSLPDWFSDRVEREPPLPRPLSPSGASGIAVEQERDTAQAEETPSLLTVDSVDGSPSFAIKRGLAIHRLLQMLPSVEPEERPVRAVEYCRRLETRWSGDEIEDVVSQALSVIDDPAHAALFGKNSAAEAPVMGTLTLGGERRAVSGVIDRIAVDGDRVLIVDYKTNAAPPTAAEHVPDTYLRQMALYRGLVAPLYPEKTVETFLLYTAAPRMIALPRALLDESLAVFNSL
ncbi:double-strand break repair helicase AddA [Oricola cellulosilytica]|nr:double-strand break repair helicase AddA [Oricola cellulosilytica]